MKKCPTDICVDLIRYHLGVTLDKMDEVILHRLRNRKQGKRRDKETKLLLTAMKRNYRARPSAERGLYLIRRKGGGGTFTEEKVPFCEARKLLETAWTGDPAAPISGRCRAGMAWAG